MINMDKAKRQGLSCWWRSAKRGESRSLERERIQDEYDEWDLAAPTVMGDVIRTDGGVTVSAQKQTTSSTLLKEASESGFDITDEETRVFEVKFGHYPLPGSLSSRLFARFVFPLPQWHAAYLLTFRPPACPAFS